MDAFHAAIFFAVMTGIASSGLIGSVWAVFADEPPRAGLLLECDDLFAPFKIAVVVLTLPTIVLNAALWWLIARPPVGLFLLVLGILWSFVQGVFIMTQLFNIT